MANVSSQFPAASGVEELTIACSAGCGSIFRAGVNPKISDRGNIPHHHLPFFWLEMQLYLRVPSLLELNFVLFDIDHLPCHNDGHSAVAISAPVGGMAPTQRPILQSEPEPSICLVKP
jgi:hypothetical protein